MFQVIINELEESIKVKKSIQEKKIQVILEIAELLIEKYKKGKKVILFGNGGSAADAQHIACEFVSKFRFNRIGLPAIALTVNTSVLTAIGNDYGYENVFARQVQALASADDVVIGISTSGNSSNVICALQIAKQIGAVTVGFTGESGGKMRDYVDYLFDVPSFDTPRIQEAHITVGHIICGIVEERLFNG
jgi:D-sedoheptulose 7-phosphate isomerase